MKAKPFQSCDFRIDCFDGSDSECDALLLPFPCCFLDLHPPRGFFLVRHALAPVAAGSDDEVSKETAGLFRCR